MKLIYTLIAVLTLLGACVPYTPSTPEGETVSLPPEVLAVLAPGQAIDTARIESDGCYWVEHRGPVETTYIPLKTRDDRLVCTRTVQS